MFRKVLHLNAFFLPKGVEKNKKASVYDCMIVLIVGSFNLTFHPNLSFFFTETGDEYPDSGEGLGALGFDCFSLWSLYMT